MTEVLTRHPALPPAQDTFPQLEKSHTKAFSDIENVVLKMKIEKHEMEDKYNNLRIQYENVNKENSNLKMNMSQLENEIAIERNDMSNWLLYWHQ